MDVSMKGAKVNEQIQLLFIRLAHELRCCGEGRAADLVRELAESPGEQQRLFLQSNEIWGGRGSIAEKAGGRASRSDQRKRIEHVLQELGAEQIRLGLAIPRTSMWVDAFKKWADMGV
jgi:hypothetical protein